MRRTGRAPGRSARTARAGPARRGGPKNDVPQRQRSPPVRSSSVSVFCAKSGSIPVVGVHDGQVAAAACISEGEQAVHAGDRLVFRQEERADAPVARGEGADQRGGPVGGAVVAQEIEKLRVPLAKHALHALLEERFGVIGPCEKGDAHAFSPSPAGTRRSRSRSNGCRYGQRASHARRAASSRPSRCRSPSQAGGPWSVSRANSES